MSALTPLNALKRKVRRAIVWASERRAGIVTGEDLSIPDPESPDSVGYSPSSWRILNRILKRSEVQRDDVFIDFGSGMGRVLYHAARRYPFGRVEGVELSAELTAIAQKNLDRNRHRFRCKDIRLVTSDVLEYEIPDDLTIAYFFNPFTGAVFQSVVDRLVESVQRNPRRLRLIYLNPIEEKRLLDAGFREIRRAGSAEDAAPAMYELTPGSA